MKENANKMSDLRQMSCQELQDRLGLLKKEMYHVACVAIGSDNKSIAGKTRSHRREIARILTIRTERMLSSCCCVE